MFKGKISVIGAGFVGSTTAYTLFISGLASEVVLVDINKEKAIGEALDMNHGASFVSPCKVIAGDYSDIKGSDIVVITAGANQKPGETRIDLLKKNKSIFEGMVSEIVKYCDSDTILLVVSNPADILTYVTQKLSGFSREKVLGSGTVLDTSRLKYSISSRLHTDKRNVHTFIIGEHGDSSVATWSNTHISGLGIDKATEILSTEPIDKVTCHKEVVDAAYEIIQRKGATYYAIALAVRRIVEAIVGNENSILPVSSCLSGEYGISDIAIAVPTIVNNEGASRVLELPLSDAEITKLRESAELMKKYTKELGL